MNYFEHHIGDYDKNTAHLTACEDGIYHRLLRRYYDKERPLDLNVDEVKRIVRARTREEKKAVDDVLREFFFQLADGWHHEKCDAAIADFLAGEPEREVKKANEENRLKKHRDERARLFKIITDAGEHAAWNAPMADLRQMAERLQQRAPETQKAPDVLPPATQPATAPATPATATHTPIPILHSPDTNPQTPDTSIHGVAHAPPAPLFAEAPSAPPPAPKPRKASEPKAEAPTAGTWKAYSQAYAVRYQADPVRNATVNGQLSNLVARLGAEEAPAVAAFYVRSNNSRYVSAGHSVGMLLMDAEKLRTEWVTGRQTTATQARMADQTQTNANAFAPLIAAARERERNAQ